MKNESKIVLSVVINTKNAANTIEDTLKSVKFADEIIIVDMKSTDTTLKIAKKYTDKIFSHADVGYVEPARNYAISKAKGDWILIADADEEIPQELKRTIKGIIDLNQSGEETAQAYYIPRKNLIFGKWIERTGWWPDRVLRFFKKGAVEWSDDIHSIPVTRGQIVDLPAVEDIAIIHHNYEHVSGYLDRMNRYSTIQAEELLNEEEVIPTSKYIFKKFSSELLSRLFAQRGINEGRHGLSLSLLQALSEVSVATKVWQEQGFEVSNRIEEEELITEIQHFGKELKYWTADWKVENSSGFSKLIWKIRRKFYL